MKRTRFHYLIVHDLTAASVPLTPQGFDEVLKEGFRRELSRREIELIDNVGPFDSKLAGAHAALIEEFDAWLLFQLRTAGVALELSPLFQQRKSVWHRSDPRGSEKLRQMGEGIARAAKIWQGSAKLPLTDPRIYQTRQILTGELRLLFARFRNQANERLPIAAEAAMDWITTEITDHPDIFKALVSDHLSSLLNFLWNDATGKNWLQRIRRGEKVRVSAFFHDWWGWLLRRDSKKLANTIADLGSSPH